MSFAAVYVLSEVFASLVVPVAFVAARRRVNGPLIACATLAIVCFGAVWLLSGSQGGLLMFIGPQDGTAALRLALYAVAAVTAQAAWVLALYQAAMGRQARWLGALAAAQVIANAVLLISSNPCFVAQISGDFNNGGCRSLDPAALHLVSAAWLIGPAVALAYGLRGRFPQPRIRPRGVAVSPRAASADGDGGSGSGDADTDAELEVRTERL